MTYKEAAQAALDCQDASNLSGVTATFINAIAAIWVEARRTGRGTDWVNTHPIIHVFLIKLTDLNGDRSLDHDQFYTAFNKTRAIAEQEES